MTTEFDPEEVAARVITRLREKYPERDEAFISRVVHEEVDSLANKPVHDYVAVLSERAAKKRIKHGA